jgi:uncharacterized LabA/DUF88 family protein
MNKKIIQENNLAFIDGQNLYMGTNSDKPSWHVNLKRFRVYLKDKYKVSKAFYFLGCVIDGNDKLYDEIQDAGFILKFREHNSAMLGVKKGNVDSDIIFHIMKIIYQKGSFDKIILVSGDGDYKMLVDFLIEEDKFRKILFPNRDFASSLYKKLGSEYFDYLSNNSIKNKIVYKKKTP